jgi:hypothetical protein
MSVVPAGLIRETPFPRAKDSGLPARPSEIEGAVIRLFDQNRYSLFRYVLSFGLSMQEKGCLSQKYILS